jgi:hypothetical protein
MEKLNTKKILNSINIMDIDGTLSKHNKLLSAILCYAKDNNKVEFELDLSDSLKKKDNFVEVLRELNSMTILLPTMRCSFAFDFLGYRYGTKIIQVKINENVFKYLGVSVAI